jgi:hypothetical protein
MFDGRVAVSFVLFRHWNTRSFDKTFAFCVSWLVFKCFGVCCNRFISFFWAILKSLNFRFQCCNLGFIELALLLHSWHCWHFRVSFHFQLNYVLNTVLLIPRFWFGVRCHLPSSFWIYIQGWGERSYGSQGRGQSLPGCCCGGRMGGLVWG